MHARGGLEHERSDDVASHSHRRKDPSVRSCAYLETVENLNLRYYRCQLECDARKMLRCAVCRATRSVQFILHAIDKTQKRLRTSTAPGSDAACRRHSMAAARAWRSAQRMRSILRCALAQHAARLPSRRVRCPPSVPTHEARVTAWSFSARASCVRVRLAR